MVLTRAALKPVLLSLALTLIAGCGADGVTAAPESSTSPTTLGPPPTTAVSDRTAPATLGCTLGPPCYGTTRNLGTIVDEAPEASGVAVSSTDPELLFVVDDGSKNDKVIAVSADGTVLQVIDVKGMKTDNAEAIVNGPCEPGATERCLYIGDIGADPGRSDVTIYRIAEPDATDLPSDVSSDELVFDYPDGEYDAEALMIGEDGSVVIVTKPKKGRTPARIYRGAAGGGDLELVAEFTPPEPLVAAQSLVVGTVITDASRLPDRVLLLTYDQAIEYLAPSPGADPATFSSWPYRQLPIPLQWQSEGISYRAAAGLDRCGYLVVSEQGGGSDGATIGTVDCS